MSHPPQNFKVSLSAISALLSAHSLLKKSHNTADLSDRSVEFTTNSRKSGADTGFIAYAGVVNDGHRFIPTAAPSAAFIICEKDDSALAAFGTPVFVVTSGRAAWSVLAAKACGNPETKLQMIGVTGTNGKTSTAWMVRQLLGLAGIKVAMVGTLGAWIGDDFCETGHTTPDPDFFYPFLRQAVDANTVACIMEVSSHAIAQDKLLPVIFSAAAFTSFSRDHLDFHKNEEEYWQTKCLLFDKMTAPAGPKFVCSGLQSFPAATADESFQVYGLAEPASTFPKNIERVSTQIVNESLSGTTLAIALPHSKSSSGTVPFFGLHALENFTAALLLASTVSDKIWNTSLWEKVEQVPGRLEKIDGKSGRIAFVDYAHTPDALEKTLVFLKKYKKNRLIVVFGCGGDRDAGKRPLMGRIAEDHADLVFVTSDNPRTEDPAMILKDIQSGMSGGKAVNILDRRLAIQAAVRASEPDDVILIAGKGHETYQIVGKTKLPFDDRDTVREFLI